MLFSNSKVVLAVLLNTVNDGNGWMTMEHEIKMANWRTEMGRTFVDPDQPYTTHERITGYSLYSGHNAGGEFTRVVAHKSASHVMTFIKIRVDLDIDGFKESDLLLKVFGPQFSELGGTRPILEQLIMAHLHGLDCVPHAKAMKLFLDQHADIVDRWAVDLGATFTPILSKDHAHEMLMVPDTDASPVSTVGVEGLSKMKLERRADVFERLYQAVERQPSLSQTVWY